MSTPTPYNALNLLVQASRVSPPLRNAVQVVEDHIRSLTLPAGEWRVSVADDGTRTVTPLVDFDLLDGRAVAHAATHARLWADAPENGDLTDEG